MAPAGAKAGQVAGSTPVEYSCAEDVRRHVHDISHQEPAGRTALTREGAGLGDSRVNECMRAVDEVGEGVLLLEVLARRLVPFVVSHLATAADVRDRIDHLMGCAEEGRGDGW